MKLCTCTGHCRGSVGLGEGWVCSSEYYKQQAADERMKAHPADPIGDLDEHECRFCGLRKCNGDCTCPGCGEKRCNGNCGPPSYADLVFGSGI